MQAFGQQNGIAAFTDPECSLNKVNGHLLSMIGSGLCGADAYYRGPYEGGAAFMLLTAPEIRTRADSSVTAFIRQFTEFISAYSCEHRAALEAYARYKSYACTAQPDGSLLCTAPAGASVSAAFDDLGRLKEFIATLTTDSLKGRLEPAAPKKPWWKFGG